MVCFTKGSVIHASMDHQPDARATDAVRVRWILDSLSIGIKPCAFEIVFCPVINLGLTVHDIFLRFSTERTISDAAII
ncbi:MAG: hypothetical protein RIQ52_2002 [Pseudomonadota bacterium]